LVWCLLISEIPFLYGLFNWNLVSPERRRQLLQACEAQAKLSSLAYQEMQLQYQEMRQALFSFLVAFADFDTFLTSLSDALSPLLADEPCFRFHQLIEQGRVLFSDATAHARKMLQEQSELFVADVVKLDENNQVSETLSLPLFPHVPIQDRQHFFEYMSLISDWQHVITTFWEE
jgi:hypothetical protein